MSTDRKVGRLLWWYPENWRSRYGEEFAALIADMSDEGPVPWRLRLNVIAGGARERLVTAFGGRQQSPEARTLGGTLLVLWAWALFVLGGSIVGKTTEHWQDTMPGGPSAMARTAFDVLIVGAVAAAALVLAGVGRGFPRFLSFLRAGGWPLIRRRVLVAVAVSVLAAVATAGVIVLARSMDDDHGAASGLAYTAFLGWAGLGAVCLFCWTAAASLTARHLDFSSATLRVQSWLATTVSLAMHVMTVATAAWWLTVARAAPGALTGSSDGGQASAVPTDLVVAMLLMVLATAAAPRALGVHPRRGMPCPNNRCFVEATIHKTGEPEC